mmetsp:Transcript_28828/g.63760  ORF Transcript_28828/g.63760 Transcript_28828/m.63760 type:complete len:352 (-) Transcript_28828:53-1108(-)
MRTTQQYGGGSGHRSNRTERQLTRVRRVASVGGLGYCLDQRLMRDVAFGDFDCWSSLAQQWKPSVQSVSAGISGFAAGCAGKTITAPLSRMEVILQTTSLREGDARGIREFWKAVVLEEGKVGLWTGNTLACITRGIGSGISFAMLEVIPDSVKELKIGIFPGLTKRFGSTDMNFQYGALIPGTVSCLITSCLTQPFEVVRSSQMARIGDCPTVRTVVQKVGSKLLSRGFGMLLIVNVPRCGICYGVYPECKARLPHLQLGGVDARPMVAGGVAGVVANMLTYPLDVLRCRQMAKDIRGKPSLRIRDDISGIFKEHNSLRGFYNGACFDVIKVSLNMAVTFKLYECLRHTL